MPHYQIDFLTLHPCKFTKNVFIRKLLHRVFHKKSTKNFHCAVSDIIFWVLSILQFTDQIDFNDSMLDFLYKIFMYISYLLKKRF